MTTDTDLARLLLLDDEPYVIAALQRLLRQHFGRSLRIDAECDPLQALALAGQRRWDAVLCDYRMPQLDGLEFLRRLSALQPHAVRMVLSASCELQTVMRAVNDVGVFRYLVKPWQTEQVIEHVQAALSHARALREQRTLADAMRVHRGELGAEEAERRRLEEIEPGITHVEWGPNGEVLMPPLPRARPVSAKKTPGGQNGS
jgi:response regulator RpfG family c-di-GMP phosphodiesterase